ncbi:long-chain acyl-CoA synthetase [Pseudomonas sp. PIC25]|uniref:AMP-binding protein n=1 Tax=Pseudomonas sp. PIC25 TaxID=1958773 RepID=UPI000BAB99BF|nr:AMP-binding protein [Pseudomonas sp. PIC25]PAU54668.1 long-chain acyl-CoA synthetase [Pseudomonas sp. PIC25]
MQPAIDRLWAALAAHGERVALRQGALSLSYVALRREAEERAGQLEALCVRRVALALDNGPEWALWDLALLRAGKVCVPLPGFFSSGQRRHVLDSAGIDTLIGAADETARALGFEERLPGLWQRDPGEVTALPAGTRKITYTSGTTGQPKGVCLDAEVQLRVAESLWQSSRSREVERHLCILPLAVLLENIAGIYVPLLAGAEIDLPSLADVGIKGGSGLDLPCFLTTLAQSRPHSLILLPQLLLALVTAAERGMPLPDSLRFVAVGGGRVAEQLLQRADALGLPVFEGYGLSECASVVCLNTPEARRIGTVGKPLPHLEVRLSEDGEVLVRGARLLGYLGEPAPQDEWLATGDLGHFDEGFLVLHGRRKHQFITAYGRNVNPEWVEAELVQQLPIAQAWLHGEALAENIAVLVPRFPTCSDDELAAAVAKVNRVLPDYARVHRWLRAEQPFNEANGLATANGRLRRAALLDHYQSAFAAISPEDRP